MTIHLSSEHQQWLVDQVAAGLFPSIDAAVACAIDNMIDTAGDDLEWAQPLIAKGDVSLAGGRGIPSADVIERLDRKLDGLR